MNRRFGAVAIVLMALTALAAVCSFVFFSQPVPKNPAITATLTNEASSSTSTSTSTSTKSAATLPSPAPEGPSSAANLPNQSQGRSTTDQNTSTDRVTQKTSPAASAPRRTIADILDGVDLSKPGERERVVMEIKAIEDQRLALAIARAKELGLPIRIEKPGGGVSEVADIDEHGQLLYRTTYNLNAAISTGANLIRQTLPYGLSGNGIKVGVWDGGLVRNTHVEFSTSRVVHMNFTNLLDHATHVAGTIGASGISSSAKGMAPGVAIDSYDWNSDNSEMTSAGAASASDASRIPISNHSYGLTTQTNDAAYMGRYTLEAANNDALLASAPFYLPFWAAGNDQQRLNAKGGFQSITFEALAKNVLTIGNVNDALSGGQRNPTNGTIWSTSSWGPSDDGRIKPDVVANGVGVYSPIATSDTDYASYTGTSMAAPNAAGSAVLLTELYKREFSGELIRASLLKALLIHTADDLGNPGPDYKYGWGLINVKAAADLIHLHKYVTAHPKFFTNTITRQVSSRTHTFQWDGSSPIRATLCWTDPAGVEQTDDSRTAVLVRNLDLKITAPNGITLYQPFVMPFVGNWTDASMNSSAITGKNNVDNVEQVYITSPNQAGTYTATVSIDGNLSSGQIQPYSLVISGSSQGTAPTVGNIPDQTVALGNSAGPVSFTIGDAEAPASALSLSASSSNPSVLSEANIIFGGSGANRTITMTPTSGITGTTTITVTVYDGGLTTTDSFILTVTKGTASVNMENTNQIFNGTARPVTVTTVPPGLANSVTYNGSSFAPTNSGSYNVIATVNDSNYQGAATNTLTISKAAATVTLSGTSQSYNGSARTVSVSTTPSGLSHTVTYNGSSNAPTNAGTYIVVASVNEANYEGSATGTLTVAQATQTITFSTPATARVGEVRSLSASATPSGLPVTFAFSDNSIAVISGSQVTFQAAGGITLTASQSGNGNYLAASTMAVIVSVSGVENPVSDQDGDGVPALVEYALGGGTNGNDQSLLPVATLTGSTLSMSAVVRTNDTNLLIYPEATLDLGSSTSWTSSGFTTNTSTNGVPEGFAQKTYEFNASTNRRAFLKLTIQQN